LSIVSERSIASTRFVIVLSDHYAMLAPRWSPLIVQDNYGFVLKTNISPV